MKNKALNKVPTRANYIFLTNHMKRSKHFHLPKTWSQKKYIILQSVHISSLRSGSKKARRSNAIVLRVIKTIIVTGRVTFSRGIGSTKNQLSRTRWYKSIS